MDDRPGTILSGTPASPGYAEGLLFRLDAGGGAYVTKGSPEAERAALQAALDSAVESLGALAGAAAGEAAEMLEFQIAMLEDEALTGPAFAAIAEGMPADAAWKAGLDAEIIGYEGSEDEYFAARAADLRDLCDRVLRALGQGEAEAAPAGAILFGEDIAPTRFLEADWTGGGGIALTRGSAASHVAMLARSRGVPMVVGLGEGAEEASGFVLLDAEHGRLVLSPPSEAAQSFRQRAAAFAARGADAATWLARPAATRDGTPVAVKVNIADPAETESVDIAHCDGVGLMRTEFLFGSGLPDEETQYAAYRTVLEWAGDKPVTIRTVDAGGDKPVPGFTVEEQNPFLGLRGIRLSLARPEVFRVQIRALLRAAVHGNLRVMFPMVSVPDEFAKASVLFTEEAGRLGLAVPPLGIMVEVPSVAVVPEAFADATFFSIGSNDLTQYVMAAARDSGAVAGLNDVKNPAVLRLISQVAAFGTQNGVPVGLCGDAGGDPAVIPALLGAGLRELSAAPARLAEAKAAIASCDLRNGAHG